ncbi:MAG: ArsA family ATPase, partial [Thermoanaerobaculia bacterium]
MTPLDGLRRRELLVVTGKGGVGKTTVAATLGKSLAAAGRRTLVLEVDPRENLHQMVGLPPSGGVIVPVEPRLWVQNLKPVEVLDAVVREQLKLEPLVRRVLDSPIYQHFALGAPGLREMAILGHALRLLRGIG